MSRLIVVSNRLPKGDVPSGGLIFALDAALRHKGGLWIGADDPQPRLTAEEAHDLRPLDGLPYDRLLFPLTEAEHAAYYLGYANSVLWPLCHRRTDLVQVRPGQRGAYHRVNQRVAQAIALQLQPDDVIWVHDYHFFPLAHELRQMGVTTKIGFFLHIPFPTAPDLMALPDAGDMLQWLAAYDLLGLQTERDVAAARDLYRQDDKGKILPDGGIWYEGREFRVASFPIGVDAEGLKARADASDIGDRLNLSHGTPLVLGVDRLDYSKGLVHRTAGFGRYLAQRSSGSPRPTYLQIAPVSREDVPAYRDVRDELERTAASINGAYADLDWTPIRYVRRNVDRDTIAGLYRRANVALVTPLADGMNLVAKEFIAAQDPDDPGVLILSRFAGAAEQLDEALLINPYDPMDVATAIGQALIMPQSERIERYDAMAKPVFGQDIGWWTETYLQALEEVSGTNHLHN